MSKRLETVATVVCMKTLLLLYNFIFSICGWLMLCIGIWMCIQLQDKIEDSMEGGGALLLVVANFGAIMVLVGTLACCCTTRGHPALLYLYGAFLAVVAALHVGAGASIYAYRETLRDGFDYGLNGTMASYGQETVNSGHVDVIQSVLRCCGNRGYADWLNVYPQKEIPLSCCKFTVTDCDTNDTDQIYLEGCYNRILGWFDGRVWLIIVIAIGVAFPLVGVFLACCLASNINKAKYEQVA